MMQLIAQQQAAALAREQVINVCISFCYFYTRTAVIDVALGVSCDM